MTSHFPRFHTSTPKDSGARPKTQVSGDRIPALGGCLCSACVALEKEPDSMNKREIDREFQDLTACYERVKNEYEKRMSASQNKSANTVVDNGIKIDKKVTFKNTTQVSPVSLGISPHHKETELDALHRQTKELEIQELDFSLALHRSQLEACKTMAIHLQI